MAADSVAVDTSVIATRAYADAVGSTSDGTARPPSQTHEADTTGVHGIVNTGKALVCTNRLTG